MSDFDIDLTAPLDDNILKDFSPSYQTQPMGHMNQSSQMMQNQQLNRGQQMRPQVQINQIRQQLQNSSVIQQSNSPSPVVSSPSPNPVNSPQPQLQKLNTQQNIRIAPQQINYQQGQQQQPITLVSNAPKNYMNQPQQQQTQSMAYQQQQQQFQQKVQPQQLNNSTSATRINSQYQTTTTSGGVTQSNSQTNNMSQQHQPAILVKNSNGQYQVLTPSTVQSNKPNVQQTNSTMNIQQQQQQQQQLNRGQLSQQGGQNQTIVRFPQGNIQQQGQQQVISAQQLNQQGQNLVVITTSNGGLTTLSNSNSSNLIASIKTQPQQNNQQQNQNYVYQNKTNLVQSQGAGYNVQSDRNSLTPTPNSMMIQQQQQQQQRSVQQSQQPGAGTQANAPTGIDLLKCLRKFLHTLLDLAKNSLPEKFQVVQNLIQELLDERIDPDTFIKKIQIERNPPSPSLVPFLTKAINQWKQMRGNQSVTISKFFEMIPPPTQQQAPSAQPTTQALNQQQPQQQNTPIVIAASGSNTSSTTTSQTTTNNSSIPIITSISQGSLSHGQNVLILNRSSSNVGQQQVQNSLQQPIQQQRAAPQQQQIQQNGAQLTQQQLQIKYQQHQHQQQQQKMQQVQIQNQVGQAKTSSPQIQFISTGQNGSFTIQPQYNQSAGKVTIQQQQQLQQSPHGTNIALAKVASSQYQAQSPQQIQQNAQPSAASVKILNSSITNLKQITSPINQSSVIQPMVGISSPIKIEQHHLGQHTPQSPAKLVPKVIKVEEIHPKIKTESDDESTSMFGVDLEAEKKTLMGSSTVGRGNNLEQIRVFKEEKFLNIMILHKKFVEIAKKHKLDDVSVDVATLVSHATQEYLRGILEKLNVVSQHRLDLSMRTNDAYEMTNDVKSQIKFMEELDKIEKKRKDEADRERLMKAAKSRSKGEDGGELSKLKQKAKEVIQAESDELRRQDANKTALAAIGPRKKRKIEDGGTSASGGIGQSTFGSRVVYKPKIKRVSLRDLIFVLEQEKEFRRSTILYKALNK